MSLHFPYMLQYIIPITYLFSLHIKFCSMISPWLSLLVSADLCSQVKGTGATEAEDILRARGADGEGGLEEGGGGTEAMPGTYL